MSVMQTEWFPPSRAALAQLWHSRTTMTRDGSTQQIVCSLLDVACNTSGHLSLPCAIADEADQIQAFLNSHCFDDRPQLFFRLLLILLDEFTECLCKATVLCGAKKKSLKQPDLLSIWTNHYAKHRQAIIIQHHAEHYFTEDLTACLRLSPLGMKILPIDTEWLKKNPSANLEDANADKRAVIVVPKLSEFVAVAIDLYVEFVNFCKSNPAALERFHSLHH